MNNNEAITITIYKNSEGDYNYDIYNCEASEVEDTESLDGGTCTTTLANALDMAVEQTACILKEAQKNCKHLNICATETYGVQGSYDEDSKKYLVKQGDGGLNDDIECEDCGEKLSDAEIEFV